MTKLKIGIIGISEGNGHPYSWSAIFNGYNEQYMKECNFPVIPEYLSRQNFPQDFLTDLGSVTHVWTQDISISKQIAAASKILNIVEKPEDMIGEVDAVLLARDDGENHVRLAMSFIQAGLPIFIDKPFALSVDEAEFMFRSQSYENQIFTCSSLRFANELLLTDKEKEKIGNIMFVEGSIVKKWETYGIHIIEPLVAQLPHRGKLISVHPIKWNGIHKVLIKWENCLANLTMTGLVPSPLTIRFFGKNDNIEKHFTDSFSSFKASLKHFVEVVHSRKSLISKEEILEMVEIIEKGRC